MATGRATAVKVQKASNTGTMRTVKEPARGPVTAATVKQLASEKYLRGVAEIARKYAKVVS